MKTYKDIDEFIIETFPLEYQKIIKQRKSRIAEFIENADSEFAEKLEAIITGKPEQEETAKA